MSLNSNDKTPEISNGNFFFFFGIGGLTDFFILFYFLLGGTSFI